MGEALCVSVARATTLTKTTTYRFSLVPFTFISRNGATTSWCSRHLARVTAHPSSNPRWGVPGAQGQCKGQRTDSYRSNARKALLATCCTQAPHPMAVEGAANGASRGTAVFVPHEDTSASTRNRVLFFPCTAAAIIQSCRGFMWCFGTVTLHIWRDKI